MKLSIISVNFHNEKETIACFRALDKTNKGDLVLSFIVVDNEGSAASGKFLSKNLPGAIVITSQTNLGFAGGSNLGIKRALRDGADYVLLINPDTLVETQNFLPEMINTGADLTAPLIRYRQNGQIIYDHGGKVEPLFGRNTHLTSTSKNPPSQSADYFTGACLLIKTSVFRKIGFLDPGYFLYYEDADFCLRAAQAGFTQKLCPGAIIFHHLSTTTSKIGSKKIAITADSHLRFCRRHLPAFSFPFYISFNLYLKSKLISNFLDFQRAKIRQFLYPYLNRLFCFIHRTPELHLVGDSHIWSYEHHHPFIIHHLGAATAYNLASPLSTTSSYQKLQNFLQKINPRRSIIIFELGEIDCRLHIYNRYRQNSRQESLQQITASTISRYLQVVQATADQGFRVAVLSPTPTGTEGNIYHRDFFADFQTRNKISFIFQSLLKKETEKRSLRYLDLYPLVSAKNGGIKKSFRADDVHLNAKVVPLTLGLLKDQKLHHL